MDRLRLDDNIAPAAPGYHDGPAIGSLVVNDEVLLGNRLAAVGAETDGRLTRGHRTRYDNYELSEQEHTEYLRLKHSLFRFRQIRTALSLRFSAYVGEESRVVGPRKSRW